MWEELLAFDREHVWHPYGALPGALAPVAVESAEGVRLRLADGRELIDGMASWWCAIHGYRHPALDAAARDQLTRMSHVMFGGLTHEPAVELAELLVRITPDPLTLGNNVNVTASSTIQLTGSAFTAVGLGTLTFTNNLGALMQRAADGCGLITIGQRALSEMRIL